MQARDNLGVINSGFGFENVAAAPDAERAGAIAYLGTVDFSKLSPLLFDVIDRVTSPVDVAIWGGIAQDGDVMRRAAAMSRPERVRFQDHASDPEAVFRQTGIFLYLLQPQHFGTAENALIEAMSLGCVPLVFDNPAERAIVEHGKTGFIERDVEAAAQRLDWMLHNPDAVQEMGQAAADAMATTRTAAESSARFATLYRTLLTMEKRRINYPSVLGETPLDWFLSTQDKPFVGTGDGGAARKGTWAHFATCFPDELSALPLP